MAKKVEKKAVKKAKAPSKKKSEKEKPKKSTAKKLTTKTKSLKKTDTKKTSVKKASVKVQQKKKVVKKAKPVKQEKVSVEKEIKIKKAAEEATKPSDLQKQVEETIREENEIDAQVLAELEAARRRAEALKKIKKYSKKELEHFKSIIIEKQNEIIEQLQNLRDQMLDPSTGEYINENSPYSLHMAEQGTDAMEREKVFLYAQRETKFLSYLEEALKRIEDGTYGICIACVEEPQYLCPTCPLIPKERLEAVPHTQLCLPMKQRQEKK
jgi:RNA polymerase-binding transcription factor DksA